MKFKKKESDEKKKENQKILQIFHSSPEVI